MENESRERESLFDTNPAMVDGDAIVQRAFALNRMDRMFSLSRQG